MIVYSLCPQSSRVLCDTPDVSCGARAPRQHMNVPCMASVRPRRCSVCVRTRFAAGSTATSEVAFSTHPLAHAQPLIYDHQLVRIQEETKLDPSLAIVIRSGQELILAREVEAYLQKVEFADDVVARIRPAGKTSPVVIDPEFSFGRPSIRGVATELIAELYRSGDSAEFLAEAYELPIGDINAAIAYETQLAATAA